MRTVSNEAELETLLRRIIVPGETVVVGVGSELRCDDGFGPYIARSLLNFLARYSRRECVVVVDAGTALESYVDILNTKKTAVILDAVEASVPYSEIVLLDRDDVPKYSATLSTHTIGFDVLLTLVKSDIYIVGTRPQCLDFRLGVTKPVARAIQAVIKAFIGVLREHRCLENLR